ncbi:MAG: TRAP transporter small permease subunit [Dehalococcoidales bacterium]|nr:TRAP transporter small permease subunit [Dehalococcoidales bacterium]
MKNIFLTIDRIIERVGDWGLVSSGILILLMSFLSTYAVSRRYIFHNPDSYSYELSTIFLTACAVLAVSGLQRYKRHLRVDFVANYFNPAVQTFLLDVLGPLLALVFVPIITWQSWNSALYSFNIGETSLSIWQEPLFPTKFVIPVSMFWLCLVLIAQLVRGITATVRTIKTGGR